MKPDWGQRPRGWRRRCYWERTGKKDVWKMAPVSPTFVTGRTMVLYFRIRKRRWGSGFGGVCDLVWDPGVSDAGELSRQEEPTAVCTYDQYFGILCRTIGPYFKSISARFLKNVISTNPGVTSRNSLSSKRGKNALPLLSDSLGIPSSLLPRLTTFVCF